MISCTGMLKNKSINRQSIAIEAWADDSVPDIETAS
jgi:hypothetical protein